MKIRFLLNSQRILGPLRDIFSSLDGASKPRVSVHWNRSCCVVFFQAVCWNSCQVYFLCVIIFIYNWGFYEMGIVLKGKKEARESVCVLGHNTFLGRVDRKDLLLHSYLMERKCHNKRCMKLFRRLLNSAVPNSYGIHWENMNKKWPKYHFTCSWLR